MVMMLIEAGLLAWVMGWVGTVLVFHKACKVYAGSELGQGSPRMAVEMKKMDEKPDWTSLMFLGCWPVMLPVFTLVVLLVRTYKKPSGDEQE